MKEKDIQFRFANEWIPNLKNILGKDLRLYSLEFPIKTTDGTKYADLVFEIDENEKPFDNKMIVVELKKDKIDIGAVEQVLRYSSFVGLQLYRKKKITSIIAGPSFSNWEIKMCKENGVFPLQYDLKGNMKLIKTKV